MVQKKYCRCLIDSGSQRSYVSKFLANAMQYECINESSVIHSLFGGTEVVETHKQFVVRLSSIKNDYQCNFKAFDQANICSDIPQLNIKPYLNELKTHNIFLNDVEGRHKKLLFEHSPSEIHILIGADIAGKLLTGKIKKLECGLVCIETYLGWSIMGKIPVEMENKYDCSYAFSMLVSDSKISDLWKLDTLGILDPSESQTKRELEKQTMTHFLSNVKRDEEGRFQMMLNIDSELKLSFHIFCDASRMAYATCVYLRNENENKVSCHLVQARSRVAPLKPTSICRLELLACVVGARLMKSIKQDLKEENIPTFYWTDSRNTLYWIKNEENWGVFVMNRVKEIRALTNPDAWNYVPGNLNPADIPSRGCSVETIKAKRWHEGPAWLKLNPDCWPTCDISPDKDMIDRERRKTVVSSLTNVDEEFSHFSRISSFEKIIRVTALDKKVY
ncbi:uncharacterized protein LOC118194095 [Stegodyphus dumicola]|uniref:uncharacterized protein LOC118194095 n=1 Tax=Stegodyphus dumicola TaxID=202533 RepID=UPI0015AA2C3B|nr:uncharacterized protein LOC118194095 [Stegodyphus dumicola]